MLSLEGTPRPRSRRSKGGDAAMISTSTSEGCEAVMAGAVPQEEELPAGTGWGRGVRCHLHQHGPANACWPRWSQQTHEGVRLSAGSPKGKDAPSATKMSKLEGPLSSLMAKDKCQCSGPSTGGKEVGSVVAGAPGKGMTQASVSMLSAVSGLWQGGERLGKDCADRVQREDARPRQGHQGAAHASEVSSSGEQDSPVDPQGPEQAGHLRQCAV